MNHFECKLTVRGYELDSFGHVNNSVYLQYAETAVWNFVKVSGMMDETLGKGLFPVVLESTQRYIHELKLLDTVRIETTIECSGGVLLAKHKMYNETTGKLSCKVKCKMAFVNRERIICDIPQAVIDYLERDTK